MPTAVKPMLCTLLKKPFNDPAYVYEVKWDGYRIIVFSILRYKAQRYKQKYLPVTLLISPIKRSSTSLFLAAMYVTDGTLNCESNKLRKIYI
jgi:hypothetical protein